MNTIFKGLLIIAFGALLSNVSAQTNGTFTFNATTLNQGGTYAPKNVMAIWITTSTGTFVKTLKKRAVQRVQFLYQWRANSASNITDAITGATLADHQAHTVSWNCKDVSQAVVPNGDYKVWIEFTEGDYAGPYVSFLWTKGPNAQTLTPSNTASLSNISLQWTPDFTTVKEESKVNNISVYPNPFRADLNFSIEDVAGNCLVDLFELTGRKVAHLEKNLSSSGKNVIVWNGESDKGEVLNNVIYFYTITTGDQKYSGKVFLSK